MAGTPKRRAKQEAAKLELEAAQAVMEELTTAESSEPDAREAPRRKTQMLVTRLADQELKDVLAQKSLGKLTPREERNRRNLILAFRLTATGMLEAGVPPAAVSGAILEGMSSGSPDFGAMGAALGRAQRVSAWTARMSSRARDDEEAEAEAERRLHGAS